MSEIIVIANNLRSTLNVGSILRTADGLGVSRVYLTGYTPYPKMSDDIRLPHVSDKATRQIHRSAIGAETKDNIYHRQDVFEVITELKASGFEIIALEQTSKSININDFKPPKRLAIIIGREVEGIEPEVLRTVDRAIEIPMDGIKESFNVSVATAIVLYKCRYP